MKASAIQFILVSLLLSLSANAQEQPHLLTITDEQSDEPLFGVNVYPIGDLRSGLSSNLEGEVLIENDLLEEHTSWRISYIGYDQIDLTSAELRSRSELKLGSASSKLAEVVVTADRMAAEEFTIQKMNQLEVYQNPTAKADPILAVNSMPASTTTDESANISLRGSSPLETGIMFNNVPIYNAVKFSNLNGIGTFSIFNTAIVDQVNVFPGNPPLEYGNVSSGLIAIETLNKVPEQSQTSAILSLASFGLTHTRALGEKSAVSLFSNYQPSGIIKSLNPSALEEIPYFNSFDVGVNLHAQMGTRWKVKSFTYYLEEDYEFAFRSPSFSGPLEQSTRRMFTINNLFYQTGDHLLSINTGLNFNVTNFSFSQFDIQQPGRDQFASINYHFSKGDWEVKSGLSLDRQSFDFEGVFPRYDYAYREEHPADSGRFDTSLEIPELYLYGKRSFSNRLIVGIGYRKNLQAVGGRDYHSVQVNAFYKFDDKTELIAGIGQYNRHTIDRQTFLPLGFQSRQVSLDLHWKDRKWSRQFSVYYKTSDLSIADDIHRPRQQLLGTELFGSVDLSSGLTAQASLALLTNLDEQPTFSQLQGTTVNYFLRGEVSQTLGLGWTLNMIALIREGTYFQDISGSGFDQDLGVYVPNFNEDPGQFSTYQNISISASKLHPISEKLAAVYFVSLNNILDHKNERGLIYNEDYSQSEATYFSRRLIYFGISLNF
ncbi:MAG: TonB-dependent receptor plug domain-containing protein [Cyclobacteriaceae bacterium]